MTPRPARLTGAGLVGLALIGGVLAAPPAVAATTVEVGTISELREAVADANARAGMDTIVLTRSISFATGARGTDADGPGAGDLDVTDDLRVDGGRFTIDARGVDRHFDVTRGTTLLLDRVVLTGGRTSDSGGAVRSAGTTALRGSALIGNVASGEGASGGGAFNDGGVLQVLSSRLVDNVATRAGGGIEADRGSTVVFGSLLQRNRTGSGPGNGGGLHLTGAGSVRVLDSRVVGNVASAEGGGLWNSATGKMLVQGTTLTANRATGGMADQGGGALYNDGGAMRVDRSLVQGNLATGASGSGGGILNNTGTLTVTGSTVRANLAGRAGGGIEAVEGSTLVSRSRLELNRTGAKPGNGGALHLTGAGSVQVRASQVLRNVAVEGGGVWNSAAGRMLVADSRVAGNLARGADADQGGGGLYNDGGALQVTGSNVTGNGASGASGSGGGALNVGGVLTVSETLFQGNSAVRAGGGIETEAGRLALRDVDLIRNRTGKTPGNGGGLHITGASDAFYEGGEVTGNAAASEGGGLWNSTTGSLITVGLTVRGNTAPVGPNVYSDEPGGGTFLLNGLPVLAGPNNL